mgnify:FL=1|jgi:hypothetical protein
MANDYFASKGWLTKYAKAEDSTGAWQKYVAEVQRSEMDNFNTPDLDQGADSILKPGETLEDDFDVSFRRPNAEGGFQQLVQNTDDGSRPGYAGTNPETGEGFQKGHKGFGRDLKGKPSLNVAGKNQHTATQKTAEKIQAIIDENPELKTAKDFINKKLLTQPDTQNKNVKFKKIGQKKDPDEVNKSKQKKNKIRLDKMKLQSNPQILKKMAGKEGLQLSHLSLTELDSLKNLGYLPADINIKQYHSFEKKIVANAKEIYAVQNNKSLALPEKRAEIAKLQKIDRALRKDFPKYADTKARLKVQGSNLELSGLKIGEKLPNSTVAISQTEGTFLKDIKTGSLKEKDILELSKKSLEAKIKELGGKEKLTQLLFKGGGTEVERSLVQRIVSGGGKMAISMLNPAELIKLKNLIGPGALGIMAAFEAGVVTDDVLRMGKPLNESLASNWLFKSFRPHSEEFEKQKNLLQSGKLTGSQREYALEMMKMEQILKEDKRIKMMETDQLTDQGGMGMIDGSPMIPQEKIDDAKQKLRERFDRVNDYVLEEGTGRQLENEAAMAEKEATEMAKKKFSPLFGDSGTPLVNMAPRPKNMGRGPITENKRMNLNFSIPGYTPYNKAYTPSNKEISDYYQTLEKPRALNPGEGTLIRMNLASRDGNRSIYGANDKFAEGGLAGLMKKYYD